MSMNAKVKCVPVPMQDFVPSMVIRKDGDGAKLSVEMHFSSEVERLYVEDAIDDAIRRMVARHNKLAGMAAAMPFADRAALKRLLGV